MARRTHLQPQDKRLLERLRRGQWTAAELEWALNHLDERAPTLIVQEVYAKLVDVRREQQATEPPDCQLRKEGKRNAHGTTEAVCDEC